MRTTVPTVHRTVTRDVGDVIAVKVSGSQNTGGPKECRTESESVDNPDLCRELADSDNWRCWWKEDQGSGGGADLLGSRLYPAENCGAELGLGETVWTSDAGGNKQSLLDTTHEDFGRILRNSNVRRPLTDSWGQRDDYEETHCPNGSFGDLIRADSALLHVNLEWNESIGPLDEDTGEPLGCPVNVGVVGYPGDSSTCYTEGDSYRIREVPLVAPDQVTGTGGGINTIVTDFAGVFVDKVACNYDLDMFEKSGGNQNVYIRIMTVNAPGGNLRVADTDPGPGAGGTTVKKLQLIE